ncbi:hypothetical protein [Streptomyces xantholiticus]|uniref:hypothetical protein n=1 Tax=Streptomyces xantholiticus TaxID=68285 RepID=UPI001676D24D|nr:hypothetical protein [Streptomyces xantholiticus]GGW39399.1 hypothetical protein GCM10010381_25100 [Streptomyces xantholiticus]
MSRADVDAAGLRRHMVELLTHGVPAEELAGVRVRLGLAESKAPESPATAAPGDAAAAVRAALTDRRATGLAPLVDAARSAGELDDSLTAELVRSARPARTLARLLHGIPRPGSATASLLSELTQRHLGGAPARWRGLHDALATSRETLPDLLAACPEPADGGALLPPKSVCDTLALLLEQAAKEHAAAALTELPDRTVETLLAAGSLPGASLSAAVTRHGDGRARAALARHPRIDARVLKELVAVDDTTVNAAVYRNPRCTPSLRRTIVGALHRVPLDEGLRAELLSATGEGSRSRAAPLLGSGDPELTALALAWGARKVAQRYALLRVWECRGRDAVRAALADPLFTRHVHPDVRTDVGAALGEPDGAARLRAEGEPYEVPAALPRLLSTSRGTSTLRDLLNEPYTHDIRALAAANRRAPFMPKAAEELVRHEDATDVERADFRLTLLNAPWRAGGRIAGNLTPPSRRLADEQLDAAAAEWAVGVVRAGLLDPAELVTTARPAARALQAVHALTEHGLEGGRARDGLAALVEDGIAGRPGAWAVLLEVLAEHPGTLSEAVREFARTSGSGAAARTDHRTGQGTDHGTDRTTDREAHGDGGLATDGAPTGTPARPAAPSKPVGPCGRSALGAVDLLLSLAPSGTAPLPQDPAVLRHLTAHAGADAPGWQHPDWLWKACMDQGLEYAAHRCAAPTRQDVLSWIEEEPNTEAVARVAERAYRNGIVQADDLLRHLPAAWLLRLPYGWEDLHFPVAWRRALAAFLERELGTDADAWLRLAAAARGAAAGQSDHRTEGAADTWPELLDRSRQDGSHDADMLRELCAGVGTSSFSATVAPPTPEAALSLLARGNHLWQWPLGTLLCAAAPPVLAAVLPRFGPDGPWMLAAFLLRSKPTPRVPFEHLLQLGDRPALRVLSEQSRWLDDEATARLLDLADPDVDLAVLRTTHDVGLLRRIVARPGDLAPRLVAELRADPLAVPPGGPLWLESAEPDLVELVFARSGRRLDLAQQLVGCLNLLRHGGPERLAALAEGGLLGAAATRLCQKALAAADPAAPLAARARRELSAERLVKRLRRVKGHWDTRAILTNRPGALDWDALEAEHRAEPIPEWDQIVRRPDAPHDFRLRNAVHLPVPSLRTVPLGRELTVARVRHGMAPVGSRESTDTLIDHLLTTGQLTGRDLIHEAAPAAVVLSCLNGAQRRSDAPAEVHTALAAVADLVRDRLGDDADAWHRVFARLTEQVPDKDPVVPVAALLSAP